MLPNLLFICILSSIFTHSHSQCLPNQQTMLLQLKKELIFNSTISTKLVQWNQSDEWHGVECDAAGNVVSLQLDHEAISGGMEDSSSLFKLVYLQKLNLAYNDFSILPIPKAIHKLTYLTHLNLSYAGFDGQVPSEILSLGRLVSLDMSNEDTTLTLDHPNLEMLLQNLTGLRVLYLDGAGILSSHEKTKWSHIVSSYLSNITRLSMRFCSLSGPLAKSFWQLPSLSVCQFIQRSFHSRSGLVCQFSKFNQLEPCLLPLISDFGTIDFSSNDFRGQIPDAVGDLISLRQLNFSNNAVAGSIPKSLGKLGMLESLDLSYNRLTGRIPVEIGGLTFLGFLNLSYNDLAGQIPNGPQLQNFQADSFRGNPKLCGFNLNVTCIRSDNNDSSEHENVEEDKREIEWKYVFAALGFVVGVGIVVWLLVFCRRFREKYFNKIDDIVDDVFEAINKRRHVKT